MNPYDVPEPKALTLPPPPSRAEGPPARSERSASPTLVAPDPDEQETDGWVRPERPTPPATRPRLIAEERASVADTGSDSGWLGDSIHEGDPDAPTDDAQLPGSDVEEDDDDAIDLRPRSDRAVALALIGVALAVALVAVCAGGVAAVRGSAGSSDASVAEVARPAAPPASEPDPLPMPPPKAPEPAPAPTLAPADVAAARRSAATSSAPRPDRPARRLPASKASPASKAPPEPAAPRQDAASVWGPVPSPVPVESGAAGPVPVAAPPTGSPWDTPR